MATQSWNLRQSLLPSFSFSHNPATPVVSIFKIYSESTPFSPWIMVTVSLVSLLSPFILSLFSPLQPDHVHCSAQNLPIASVLLRAKAKVLAMVTKSYDIWPHYHSDFFFYFPLIHSFSTLGPLNFSSSTPSLYSYPCCSLCLQQSSLRELQGSLPLVLQILALLPLSLSLTSLLKAASLHSLFFNSLILLFYLSTSHLLT